MLYQTAQRLETCKDDILLFSVRPWIVGAIVGMRPVGGKWLRNMEDGS